MGSGRGDRFSILHRRWSNSWWTAGLCGFLQPCILRPESAGYICSLGRWNVISRRAIGRAGCAWDLRKKTRRSYFSVSDFLVPLLPPGLFFGRIGNFINQELWGRTTELPWGVLFYTAPDGPRHPSQIYEALLEGIVLFCVLWWFSNRKTFPGQISGLFLLLYGLFRIFVEFFREPDGHIGALAFDWLTMGQLLSLPMILLGLYLMLGKRFNH